MYLTLANRNFYRAKDAILVIGVLTLVVTLIGVAFAGLGYYQDSYRDPGIDSGNTTTFTFIASSSQPSADVTFKPISGTFVYGLTHTKGTSSMRYTAKFKNVTSSYFTTLYSNGYLAKLNVKYGQYGYVGVASNKTYIFRIMKNNYYSSESKMKVDYMIR